ncbi:MAG: heparinase II/III family protein [Rhodospirillales bacterium]|nr:heparinase II/III family protein [Rhodospirillales bacterium]
MLQDLPRHIAHQALARIRERAGSFACNSPLYNWSLGGGVPEGFIYTLADVMPGDAEAGRVLCSGMFSLNGECLEIRGQCWEPVGASDNFLAYMHGFSWLRDLRALGGDTARRQARDLVAGWTHRYPNWHGLAWRPDILGQRLVSWIGAYEFFGASADDYFQDHFFESVIRQARHLSRALPGGIEGLPLLRAIRGLAYAGLSLEGRQAWLEQALDLLESEADKQILGDGCHVSRSPAQLLEALEIFIDLRAGLIGAQYPVPAPMAHTIDRMAQAVRFFRYADKRFALFHGTQEGDTRHIDSVLARANVRGQILSRLPYGGYERLTMGRSMVMMDAGTPPRWPYDGHAHASPLGFEFVYGKERVFVSCGTHPSDPDWIDALRATAAHNALTVDYRNACEIARDGHFIRRPHKVVVSREETRNAVLLEASHDGFVSLNGLTHRRRLYLGDNGHDLRGEENLTCSVGLSKPVEITLRFHLHPRVQVSLIQDGRAALLRLPGGAGWRFFNAQGDLTLENSVYLGEGTQPRKTKQLVVSGLMQVDHAVIKWVLQREGT